MFNTILLPPLELVFWLWLTVLSLMVSLSWLRSFATGRSRPTDRDRLTDSLRILTASILATLLLLLLVTSSSKALDEQGADGTAVKVKIANWVGLDPDAFPFSVNVVEPAVTKERAALKTVAKKALRQQANRRLQVKDLGPDEYIINVCPNVDDCRQYVIVTDNPDASFADGYVRITDREYRKVN